jgi:hypothetical protein
MISVVARRPPVHSELAPKRSRYWYEPSRMWPGSIGATWQVDPRGVTGMRGSCDVYLSDVQFTDEAMEETEPAERCSTSCPRRPPPYPTRSWPTSSAARPSTSSSSSPHWTEQGAVR